MSIESLATEFILLRYSYAVESSTVMEGRAAARRHQVQGMSRTKSFSSNYFSVETFLVLVGLTALLLVLPLVMPPLSPPPLLFLLLPIGIFAVLVVLAFMPSDVRNIASSCL